MKIPTIALFAILSLAASHASEIIVYGSTPGGIAASVSAEKAGRKVTLIEPTDRIGGLLTNGLSYSDFRTRESLSGFFLGFAEKVEAHYVDKYSADSPQVESCFRGVHGEPHVNLLVLREMLAGHPGITLVKNQPLESVETGAWELGRRKIISITAGGESHSGTQYIDASYEGDLMAAAGVNYHVGRESRSHYGEPMAGNEAGQADGQVQGYNFRLVMTRVAENRLMPTAPDGYDRKDFEGVVPVLESGKLEGIFSGSRGSIFRAHLPLLPNGKADVNDTPHSPVRLSMPDINDGYPEGDAETRAGIVRQHLYYNVGLLYFLQNDQTVPEKYRQEALGWGWCKDEFVETGGIPPQLYIREARRLVGQHVFTGNDTRQAAGDARSILHRDNSATIYLSDILPGNPLFATAQWLGTQGGFHGMYPDGQPKPEFLFGQYSAAFPGHFVEPGLPLAPGLLKKWDAILPDKAGDTAIPKTRSEWLEARAEEE